MNAKWTLICTAFIGALAMSGAAHAGQQTYTYAVEHPFYGDIGTYTNTVDDADGIIRMDSQLRVEIRVLGVVVYQQDADRSEVWRDDRLVSFRSVSHKNGETSKSAAKPPRKASSSHHRQERSSHRPMSPHPMRGRSRDQAAP